MDFNTIKETVFDIRYTSPPTQGSLISDLTACTLFLLAQRTTPMKMKDELVAATALYKNVYERVRDVVEPLAVKALQNASGGATKFTFEDEIFQKLKNAPALTQNNAEQTVLFLALPPLDSTRYKSRLNQINGEINKFATACQVLSSTEGVYVANFIKFPMIKSYAKTSIGIRYKESASEDGLIYLFAPTWMADIARKYCPDAISTKTLAQINADFLAPKEVETPW